MKILLCSHVFSPSIGGLETVSEILAEQFVQSGHEVRVLTRTPSKETRPAAYSIIRQPTWKQAWDSVQWCDIFFHNNISLGWVWPLLLCRRPWFVAHHIWISRPDGRTSWKDSLKRYFLRHGCNLSISEAIAAALPVPSIVVGDPYNSALFRPDDEISRDGELIFLGRLVSDKGIDLLLEALHLLHRQGSRWRLTIVGDGDDRQALEQQCERLNLTQAVEFKGPLLGKQLVDVLCRHRVLVIPSRWAEPFGIVALEGISCGCLVVGSEQGGLKEAIGPCGLTFPNGDADKLASSIQRLMVDDSVAARCRGAASDHLSQFSPSSVAKRYLAAFQQKL